MESCGSVDASHVLRLYIDFRMNIYDMNAINRNRSSQNADINIHQYEDGHLSAMNILKSFNVSGQWCITGSLATLRDPFVPFYLLLLADSHLSSDNER